MNKKQADDLINALCEFQAVVRFLDDVANKRQPDKNHDLTGEYVGMNITTAAKRAAHLLPIVTKAHAVMSDYIVENMPK